MISGIDFDTGRVLQAQQNRLFLADLARILLQLENPQVSARRVFRRVRPMACTQQIDNVLQIKFES
jgi:hypothetical protein